jgi:hypothetical protein
MEFLVTTFIYPLSEPIILSKKLGFKLDNPKTDYEIGGVKDYLLRAYNSGYDYRLPIHSNKPIITIESLLFKFRDIFSKRDTHVARKFISYKRENIFDFLSSIWVIARFDDNGTGEILRTEHQRLLEEGSNSLSILEEDHPLVINAKNLAHYCYLLSLLINTEGDNYLGRTFLADPEIIDTERPVQKIWQEYIMLGMLNRQESEFRDEAAWIFLPYIRESLQNKAQMLEQVCEKGFTEKILYIASILKIVSHDVSDIKTKILMLTSIIELLLTHNPDFSRFNVEDSINKQFQLKASILIYLNNKSVDIKHVRNRLKTIYQQRSNIAHGNFLALEKYIQGLSKKEGMEEYLDNLVVDLYKYIRAILEEFLRDPEFVIFLKEN